MASREDAESEVVAATFKILVLGDSNVGKSSLIKSYTTRKKPGTMMPTIGVDYTDVVVSVRGTKVKLRIWDTAGQEKFHTFTKQFFRGTQGVLLVYDITNLDSFNMLKKWNRTLSEAELLDVITVVVGNKSDLEQERQVAQELAEQFASQNYNSQYMETSVQSGKNVTKAFHDLAENLIFSHGIFQPGMEASATDESCSTLKYSSKTSMNTRTNRSIKLEHAPKEDKKCCRS